MIRFFVVLEWVVLIAALLALIVAPGFLKGKE